MSTKTHIWLACSVVIILSLSSLTLLTNFKNALLKEQVEELQRINENNQKLWLSIGQE